MRSERERLEVVNLSMSQGFRNGWCSAVDTVNYLSFVDYRP